MRSTAIAVVALLTIAPIQQQQQPAAVIDHFILAINDLARGVADFERMTGVKPVFGGVHPGGGTQNALASLGDGRFIEVLAPDPKQPNPKEPIEGLAGLKKLTPKWWALGTTDSFALQARLNAREIETTGNRPGSRALPDGSRLQWSTFDIARPNHPWMPFFIHWTDPAKQPSRTAPGGCRLESVQIEDPNPDPLTHVLNTAGVKVTLTKSAASRMTIVLQCPKGRVTFR